MIDIWHEPIVHFDETGRAVSSTSLAELYPESKMNEHLAWAVSRWEAEVERRPLHNLYRRTLDDVWRQVIRHHGGDPNELLPLLPHDELVAANPGAAVRSNPRIVE